MTNFYFVTYEQWPLFAFLFYGLRISFPLLFYFYLEVFDAELHVLEIANRRSLMVNKILVTSWMCPSFPLLWKSSLSIICRTSLVTMDSSSFYLLWNVFFKSSIVTDSFAEYSNISLCILSFRVLSPPVILMLDPFIVPSNLIFCFYLMNYLCNCLHVPFFYFVFNVWQHVFSSVHFVRLSTGISWQHVFSSVYSVRLSTGISLDLLNFTFQFQLIFFNKFAFFPPWSLLSYTFILTFLSHSCVLVVCFYVFVLY